MSEGKTGETPQLHEDPEINNYLIKLNKNSPGHTDTEGNITDPYYRQMEVGNLLSSINMQKNLRPKATPEFLDKLQRAGLKFLANKYPDQKAYMESTISDLQNLDRYANDQEIFGKEEEK